MLKTGLLLGLVLFVGAGIFGRFVGPEALTGRGLRRLRFGHILGAVLLALFGLFEVAWILRQVLGVVEPGLFVEFLLRSRQGVTVLARLGLILALLLLGLGGRTRLALDRVLFIAFGLGLLVTVSRVSHSGALGLLPLLNDLAHVVAATAWGGSLLYAAWLPVWSGPIAPLRALLARLSAVGLGGVLLLVASGIYASTLHLFGVAAFTQTAYGGTLALKLVLVMVILVLAAVNRWSLLPAIRTVPASGSGPVFSLARVVRVEAVVLIAIFAVTGLLGTREPASGAHLDHGLDGLTGIHDGHEDEELAELQSGPIVVQLASDPNTAVALLTVRLRDDAGPVVGATVRLLESSAPEAAAQELPPLTEQPGVYGTPDFEVPEFGEWRVTVGIEFPDGRREVEELPVLPFAAEP